MGKAINVYVLVLLLIVIFVSVGDADSKATCKDKVSREFKRLPRSAHLLSSGEWRLASVDEVKSNFGDIKTQEIISSWSILRLLDGWVAGSGYGYALEQGYKNGIGEMLVVKTERTRPLDGSFDPEIYSGVELSAQGREAALLLSWDDNINEVVHFVLHLFAKVEERLAQLEKLMPYTSKGFQVPAQLVDILCWRPGH